MLLKEICMNNKRHLYGSYHLGNSKGLGTMPETGQSTKILKIFFYYKSHFEGGEKPEKYINKFINKLKCFQIEYYQENKAG